MDGVSSPNCRHFLELALEDVHIAALGWLMQMALSSRMRLAMFLFVHHPATLT
jgi:hypothetical protein